MFINLEAIWTSSFSTVFMEYRHDWVSHWSLVTDSSPSLLPGGWDMGQKVPTLQPHGWISQQPAPHPSWVPKLLHEHVKDLYHYQHLQNSKGSGSYVPGIVTKTKYIIYFGHFNKQIFLKNHNIASPYHLWSGRDHTYLLSASQMWHIRNLAPILDCFFKELIIFAWKDKSASYVCQIEWDREDSRQSGWFRWCCTIPDMWDQVLK